MPGESKAVFLSYASEDSEAAQRIADALKSAGIEVWFDRDELRGGDAWDRHIRERILDCRLFVPLISANTEAREEGYFRREWSLAADRTRDMAHKRTFIVPVVIDGTSERSASVPEKFVEIHWTRLPGGETPPAFVERIRRLLSPGPPAATAAHGAPRDRSVVPSSRPKGVRWVVVGAAALVVALLAYKVVERSGTRTATVPSTTTASSAAPTSSLPPPHSVAVLPFENMSGDPKQDYFSDGLAEELLNSLAAINELQVAARTSSFSFKGKEVDIATIAHKLNVGAVLEGSVRRSGHTMRITTQLINAATGFHLWSKTYDRDAGDILKLQTEIASSVAEALKVTLLGEVATKIELGGTRVPAAFDAYLRGKKAYRIANAKGELDAIAAFTEAIRLDPHYPLAFAARSLAYTNYAGEFATGAAISENFEKSLADARQALALAPELAEGHMALAWYSESRLEFAQAQDAYAQAQRLAPGNAQILRSSGRFAVYMGQADKGLAALHRSAVLDPLSPGTLALLSQGLYYSRRYAEAVTAATDSLKLNPDYGISYAIQGLAYYALRDFEHARASCEAMRDYWMCQQCLAVTYEKLSRHADALAVLDKFRAARGDDSAYQYATIYAQWGDKAKALEWLDTALRLHDAGLEFLKADPLMDPIRNEPRFKAAFKQLKLPE